MGERGSKHIAEPLCVLLCSGTGLWSIEGDLVMTLSFPSLPISQKMVCSYPKAAPSLQGPGVQDSFLVVYVCLKPHTSLGILCEAM